jgi:hypothetical protein
LKSLLAQLARCAPSERIELREPILAHGASAVAPLADLAASDPELGPSVTAWLEVLANRDEEARPPAIAALRVLVGSSRADTCRHAMEALARLRVPVSASRAHRAAAARS